MTTNVLKHTVCKKDDNPIRLREYLLGVFPLLQTNNAVKKAIKRRLISVNNKNGETGYFVQEGDEICMKLPNPIVSTDILDLEIVYEDDYLAVINKPAGVVCSGNYRKTIADSLPTVLYPSQEIDRLTTPLLVHRLDSATSGLLMTAKTHSARVKLGEMLEHNSIQKTYVAIVEGHITHQMKFIDFPVEGKKALTKITSIQKLETKDPASLVYLNIQTGRTHQIRKHMTALGYPLVGDQKYNKEGLSFGRGLFLAAVSLKFNHPITDQVVDIAIEIPKKFKKYI